MSSERADPIVHAEGSLRRRPGPGSGMAADLRLFALAWAAGFLFFLILLA